MLAVKHLDEGSVIFLFRDKVSYAALACLILVILLPQFPKY